MNVPLEDYLHIPGRAVYHISILVLVDVSLEAGVLYAVHQGGPVSILVLVDVSLEGTAALTAGTDQRFQSLFSWMFHSKFTIHQGRRSPALVSILVLVDVSLEVNEKRSFNISIPSFNPCSRGCFARSNRAHERQRPAQGFQSLFSWMFRSKLRRSDRRHIWWLVSILVLVDVSLEEAF